MNPCSAFLERHSGKIIAGLVLFFLGVQVAPSTTVVKKEVHGFRVIVRDDSVLANVEIAPYEEGSGAIDECPKADYGLIGACHPLYKDVLVRGAAIAKSVRR